MSLLNLVVARWVSSFVAWKSFNSSLTLYTKILRLTNLSLNKKSFIRNHYTFLNMTAILFNSNLSNLLTSIDHKCWKLPNWLGFIERWVICKHINVVGHWYGLSSPTHRHWAWTIPMIKEPLSPTPWFLLISSSTTK